jgi:Domain of unknown function (DUF3806)
MGVVTNILDALRRVGSPTQKSALARQDEQLRGKAVLSRSRVTSRNEAGTAEVFVAKIKWTPETVEVLLDDDVAIITENAARVGLFLRAFGSNGTGWTLTDLDEAFTSWMTSTDKLGYTDEAVTEILGAAYGQHCIDTLQMRWVKVTDSDGVALAVQGVEKDFRAYSYHSVSKRISARENGFFQSIYISLVSSSKEDADVPNAT